MIVARGLSAALAALAALALAGCASLKVPGSKTGDEAAPAETHTEYRLDVNAPGPLQKLLATYLDLARFQELPAADAISPGELDRLLRAAPAQARSLLETEGYFNADVVAERAGSSADGLPRVRVDVTPGPQATVAEVEIAFTGPLRSAADAGDTAALRTMAAVREQWPLKRGAPFRQSAWADAKNVTLTRLNAAGYAGASWERSSAQVQAAENRVDVDLVVESGPLYRFGELRVEGASRYDVDIVRRLATFAPGDAYSDQTLRDFQERLIKVGLYEGASVELDPDPKTSAAAPVIVRVREFALQQATVGVGYSTDTAERITLEHTHRRAFGAPWVAHQKLQLGSELQSWEGSLTSYPRDGLYRDLVSGSVSRLLSADQVVNSWNARVGRGLDTERLERLYYLEYTHTRLEDGPLTNQADAAWVNYQWIFRNLDSILLPTRGVTASAQTGAGYARGTVVLAGSQVDGEQGPFGRLYGRLTWYKPIGTGWFATARVEAGQVFTQSVAGVPDNVLFRAGGDDSVRGYGYRTLGPQAGGVTLSGRTLLTGSLEVARPILATYPAYWWAAFVDAGNAADRWSQLNPALGYGLGLRWRSPVGPLRFDVAYGQRLSQVRTYLSVGIVF